MTLRALREELQELIKETESSGSQLADVDARARPYTLNPHGSVRRMLPLRLSSA